MIKALSLLSGGLDSILATKLIIEQGISVEAINFITVFCNCTSKDRSCHAGKAAARELGISLKVCEISREYIELVKKPKYGYGRAMNPCIDCRIFIFKKASEYMRESGASFIITGEVLGERPMSQRRAAMDIIERDSGLKGYVVRPLSAKLMTPSIPEQKGWVDREKLLSIQGRSRKLQIKLAEEFGINDYPCPAGGCLLTEEGFVKKLKDLFEYHPDADINDVKLLKIGRHFRINGKAKAVISRDEYENDRLIESAKKGDILFLPEDIKAPVVLCRGGFDAKSTEIALELTVRHIKVHDKDEFKIVCRNIIDSETTGAHSGVLEDGAPRAYSRGPKNYPECAPIPGLTSGVFPQRDKMITVKRNKIELDMESYRV